MTPLLPVLENQNAPATCAPGTTQRQDSRSGRSPVLDDDDDDDNVDIDDDDDAAAVET
jgi:hypothetical protein